VLVIYEPSRKVEMGFFSKLGARPLFWRWALFCVSTSENRFMEASGNRSFLEGGYFNVSVSINQFLEAGKNFCLGK